MTDFVAFHRDASLSLDVYERRIAAVDLDEAARIAVKLCPDELFVVAIVQLDQADFTYEMLGRGGACEASERLPRFGGVRVSPRNVA